MTRPRLACLLAGCMGAAALATSALAGTLSIPGHGEGSAHGLKYIAGSFTTSGPFQGEPIDCPSSMAVVGGGVHPSGPAAQSHIVDSAPDTSSNRWTGTVTNESSPSELTVTVQAICRKAGFANLLYVEPAPAFLAPNGDGSLKANCPSKYKLVGGGAARGGSTVRFSVSAPFDGSDRDHRRDDGWKAKAHDDGGSEASLFVTAICLKTHRAIDYQSESDKVEAGDSKTLNATCPSDSAVSDGGMSVNGPPASHYIHSLRSRDSGKDSNSTPDDRWSATAVNDGATKVTAKAYAICLS